MFDFSELNAEQLEARKAELLSELDTPETRDAMQAEDMENRQAEILAIDAEIENRKQDLGQAGAVPDPERHRRHAHPRHRGPAR